MSPTTTCLNYAAIDRARLRRCTRRFVQSPGIAAGSVLAVAAANARRCRRAAHVALRGVRLLAAPRREERASAAAHATHSRAIPTTSSAAASGPPSLRAATWSTISAIPTPGSHFGSEVCALEREAVAWLMDLWECDAPGDFWGSVGRQRHRGQPLGALSRRARRCRRPGWLLQPRGALLDPESRAHPADRRDRGRLRRPAAPSTSTPSPTRSAARGRRPGHRGADLRHDGEGRARRHRRRPRLPRRAGFGPRAALRPRRRRAQRHGAAVRRRGARGDPAELPARRSTASRPRATR